VQGDPGRRVASQSDLPIDPPTVELRIPGNTSGCATVRRACRSTGPTVVRAAGVQEDESGRKGLIDEALRRFNELGLSENALPKLPTRHGRDRLPYADDRQRLGSAYPALEFLLQRRHASRRDGRPLTWFGI